MAGVGLLWELIAKDGASPAFLRVAGAADKAATATSRASKQIGGTAAAMGATGKALTKGLTVPLIAAAAVSVDQAAKWQKSMTLIQTAGGETAKKTAALSKGLETLASATGTSLADLGDGIYTVAKAGGQKWTATEQLLVMKAAAQGAKAENVDLGTATSALTSVMMSYHMSAKQAVSAENMLIRGAGLAKTSMQTYAGSLATVIPIASAAHISFSQVAGAIATLTQHGTSAEEATQELANTIRNLQAPNNVAIKAMQQLGINVTDVSKNLGKRGLTGTIDLITEAIQKKMGPSGLVAVKAFKQSTSASADLRIELSKMPKHLADISEQFQHGKMSYKDYYKAVKDLGGQQYALGKSFLTTFGQAKGFNDLLKSGSPAARTFAAYLKQVMGGATGLNTALQLGGENMAYFTKATKDISAASKSASGDVLGWAKTQDTLAVKIDKAKASLQVAAVELGTALVPAVAKLADGVQKAVHWFEGLDGTQKKVAAWSVGVLAAMGPVMSIGSRLILLGRTLGTFAVGIGNTFARIGTDAEGMSLKATRAISGLTAAMAGAGIGIAAGELTKNSSKATKAIGGLTAVGVGAAVGFGVGGPVGAAVGSLAGGVGFLASQFLKSGTDAQTASTHAQLALAAEKQSADDLLSTLESVNGAYTWQYQQSLVHKLDTSGALAVAQQAGVSLPKLVNTIQGNGGSKAITDLTVQLENAFAAGKITAAQMNTVVNAIQTLAPAATLAEKRLELENQAMSKQLLTSSQLGTSYSKLRAALGATGTDLGDVTAAGLHNNEVFKENINHLNAAAVAELKHGKSVQQVAKDYRTQITSLEATAQRLGFNSRAVQDLVAKYGKIPKSVATYLRKMGVQPADILAIISKYREIPANVNTNVNVNKDGALSDVQIIQNAINGLHGTSIAVAVAQTTQGGPGGHHAATGGFIRGAGGPTSDSIPARLSNGEFVVRASQTAKHRGLLEAINSGARGFASGGIVHKGKDWLYDGIRYASERAAQNARTNALRAAANGTSLDSTRSALSSYRQTATGVTTNPITAAYQSILSAIKQAGKHLSSAFLDQLAKENTKLVKLTGDRAKIAVKLQAAQQALTTALQSWNQQRDTVKSAVMGGFDVTSAGVSQTYNDRPATTSAGSILAALNTQVANARKFFSVLKKLRGWLPASLLNQLAAAGPSALAQAQALAAATAGQRSQIRSSYGALSSVADATGQMAATAMYGAGVHSARGLVKGLQSQDDALRKAINRIADGMVSQLKKRLGIHSPSTVMRELGQHSGEGFRLGLVDKVSGVQQASKQIGGAATGVGGSGNGGGDVHHHWHAHGIDDPNAFLISAQRRMAQREYQNSVA